MRLLPSTKSRFDKTLKNRMNMLKNLVSNIILNEQIVTTPAKVNALRPVIEMLIKNVKNDSPELKQEVEAWTVNHQKTIPLLYGPLKTRYQNKENGFTRTFDLLNTEYRHKPLSVLEFVDGPKDTLNLLEKYKPELAKFKKNNENLFEMPVNTMIQNIKSFPKGRLHRIKAKEKEQKQFREHIQLETGKLKSSYIMKLFAKNAIGQDMPTKLPNYLKYID